MIRKTSLFLAALMTLTACQTEPDHTGAAVTPLLASAAVARPPAPIKKGVPGLLLAGWANSDVLGMMDDSDMAKEQLAERRAENAPVGQQVTWNNPDTGLAGTIFAASDGYNADGTYCRTFRQTVSGGGRTRQGVNKACQQADGTWKIAQ